MQKAISQNRARHGFTLIELSIVLVIIGLLIGGILAGQTLIRNSQVQSVIADLNKYRTATLQFKDQYNGLPGDLPDATSYWGAADGSTGLTAACFTTVKTGSATCNGNGDGNIDVHNYATGFDDGSESYLAWQQIANAGLVSGFYNGTSGFPAANNQYGSKAGSNVPSLKIGNAQLHFWAISATFSGDVSWPDGTYKNIMFFSSDCKGVSGCYVGGMFLSPVEMWNIDQKIDDGLPLTGQMRIIKQAACNSSNAYLTTSNTASSCYGFIGLEQIY